MNESSLRSSIKESGFVMTIIKEIRIRSWSCPLPLKRAVRVSYRTKFSISVLVVGGISNDVRHGVNCIWSRCESFRVRPKEEKASATDLTDKRPKSNQKKSTNGRLLLFFCNLLCRRKIIYIGSFSYIFYIELILKLWLSFLAALTNWQHVCLLMSAISFNNLLASCHWPNKS